MCRLKNFAVATLSKKELKTSYPPEEKRSRPTKPGSDDLHGGKFRCRKDLPQSRLELQTERGIIKQKLESFTSGRKLNLKIVSNFIEDHCSDEKLRELEEDAYLDGPDSKKARVQREIDEMVKAVRRDFLETKE